MGSTTIRWRTGGGVPGQVYLYLPQQGGGEQLFAQGVSGSVEAPWISAGAVYEFRLYAGSDRTRPLEIVRVTRSTEADGSSAWLGFPQYLGLVLLSFAAVVLLLAGGYYLRGGQNRKDGGASLVRPAAERFSWLLWVLAVTAFFFIANHLLVRGLAVGIWDAENQFYPYYTLVADHARAGQLLYWDPWSNAGEPKLGDPQVGAFFPLQLLLGLLVGGKSAGFVTYWLLAWWLGGLGMLLLGRHLEAPAWGVCIVALGFLFCGLYLGQAQHTSYIVAFSFLPFIIWRLDRALCAQRMLPSVQAGALWGLSALGGYPSLTIITGCFAALWALGRWLCGREVVVAGEGVAPSPEPAGWPAFRLIFSAVTVLFFVGLLVLFPVYFAFYFEGAGVNPRVGALPRLVAIGENALHPGALSTFAGPALMLLKLLNHETLWPYTGVDMSSIHCGVVIPVLALLALLRRPRERWRWWLAALGALSLAFALGEALPLRGWLYDWFYPTRFFRHSATFRVYYLFAVSVLALISTRDLAWVLARVRDRTWPLFAAASGVLAAAAILVVAAYSRSVAHPGDLSLAYTHAAVGWIGIFSIALAASALPQRFRRRSVPLLLMALAGTDALLTVTLSQQTLMNSASASVQHWRELDKRHVASLDLTRNGLRREKASCAAEPCGYNLRNEQIITKTPVLLSYGVTSSYHMALVWHPILNDMAVGRERVWFSSEVARVGSSRAVLQAFLMRTDALGAPPLVVHSPEELLDPERRSGTPGVESSQVEQVGKLSAATRISVNLKKYVPGELAFDVDAPSDGWLLVTDRWARSWRGEVNGKEATVYGGNFIFRAVQVARGHNHVRFVYHPLAFPWLVLLSWGTLAAVAAASVAGRLRRKVAARGFDVFCIAQPDPPRSGARG